MEGALDSLDEAGSVSAKFLLEKGKKIINERLKHIKT